MLARKPGSEGARERGLKEGIEVGVARGRKERGHGKQLLVNEYVTT
jgi:hypothetical protein